MSESAETPSSATATDTAAPPSSPAPRPTLFLSDQHLSPLRPRALAAFRAFCAGPARTADAVYMLGDLFDFWIGDDQMREPFVADVVASIRALSDARVRVLVAHGNRDFLLGARFAAATGARFLAEDEVIDLHGMRTLVCHGDALCTDDVAYQAYRSRMRDPTTQRRLLRLPYFARRLIAQWMQKRSADAKSGKPEAIMDVTPAAVADALRRHDAARLIHGHTHRPARHLHVVDGRERERIVLGDWHDDATYLEVRAEGTRVRAVPHE